MELTDDAQKVLDYLNEGKDPEESIDIIALMDSWFCSDGFEYGLIEGGYIKPEDILKGESLKKFNEALIAYKEFKDLWQKISYDT